MHLDHTPTHAYMYNNLCTCAYLSIGKSLWRPMCLYSRALVPKQHQRNIKELVDMLTSDKNDLVVW